MPHIFQTILKLVIISDIIYFCAIINDFFVNFADGLECTVHKPLFRFRNLKLIP